MIRGDVIGGDTDNLGRGPRSGRRQT